MVEDLFHPNAGYLINILSKYLSSFGHDVSIVTAELDKAPAFFVDFFGKEDIQKADTAFQESTVVKIARIPMVRYISGRAVFSSVLRKAVDGLNPDVVFVSGNDTLSGMYFIRNIKNIRYALVTDTSMVDMASKNKLRKLFYIYYKLFYTPTIKKYRIPVIRTQDDDFPSRRLGIPMDLCPWISYGSDLLLFHPDKEQKRAFRRENGIDENSIVILYAGKLDESKGGMLLAEALLQKFDSDNDFCFLIVGNTSGEYGQKVEENFSNSENRIIRFPTQSYSKLADFYRVADIALFPKQCSLSFYDVQACGLPVISENNNVNIDRCSHGNGWNFRAGDVQDFRQKISDAINLPKSEFEKYSENAYRYILENYNYEVKAREYEKIIIDTSNRFKANMKDG